MTEAPDPDLHLFRAALTALGEGVTLADVSGRILYSNPAADRILGVPASGEDPSTWAGYYGVFLPGTETPFPTEGYPLVRALAGEDTDDVLMWIRSPGRPEGALISVTGRPVRNGVEGVEGAVVVFRDVTDLMALKDGLRTALEEVQRSQDQKQELMEFLVHDMKSPLTAILGSAHLLLGSALDEEDRKDLEQIVGSATKLHTMVLDLLDIQVAEGGHLKAETGPVDLPGLLREAGERARARGAKVLIDCPEGTTVEADDGLLTRAVANLVDNCIKYGPEGGRIWLHASRDADGSTRLSVRDEGPGVPADLREAIFLRYAQAERGPGRRRQGSRGLGLRFCKVATEAHGGRIWVEDAEPTGAIFHIALPPDPRTAVGGSQLHPASRLS